MNICHFTLYLDLEGGDGQLDRDTATVVDLLCVKHNRSTKVVTIFYKPKASCPGLLMNEALVSL